MNRDLAMYIWEAFFDDEQEVVDPFGYAMVKAAYNDWNSAYGWSIDHIWPLGNDGIKGSDDITNMQPLSMAANAEKGNLTRGRIDEYRFAINDWGTDENGKKIGRMIVREDDVDYDFIEAYDYPW